METNHLIWGDNLPMLRERVADDSVNLVYLDPPFNSQQAYNVLFKEQNGVKALAQIKAFEDTWTWDEAAAVAYDDVVRSGGRLADALVALRAYLGTNDMLAYLAMMAPRLLELHRVLKPSGSLYLHCDPSASHYLKILLDAVFGPQHFINEIVWLRSNAHNFKTRYWPRQHDIILVYVKSEKDFTLSPVYQPYGPEQLKRYKQDEHGRWFTGQDLTVSAVRRLRQFEWRGTKPPAHRSWGASREQLETWYAEGKILLKRDGTPRLDGLKVYLDETKGKQVGTVWTDIARLSNTAAERLGYPTQKPLALLERIICSSTKPGDVVLDPFCGCGTSVDAAEKLGRKWIGIDITSLAIRTIKKRLRDVHGPAVEYEEYGEPPTRQEAEMLARLDPMEFQAWISAKLRDTKRVPAKRGADRGVDDRIYFIEPGTEKQRQIVVSVKSGHSAVSHVRELRGVIDRDKAAVGVLVTLHDPTPKMKEEARGAGLYETAWGSYPRIQLLTAQQILDGQRILYPNPAAGHGRKRTRPHRRPHPEQLEARLFTKHEAPQPQRIERARKRKGA